MGRSFSVSDLAASVSGADCPAINAATSPSFPIIASKESTGAVSPSDSYI
jgi:hypothetical protein